jgi:hypothetical protein
MLVIVFGRQLARIPAGTLNVLSFFYFFTPGVSNCSLAKGHNRYCGLVRGQNV